MERRLVHSLPFSQIRDDVERLFSSSDKLDAEVILQAVWAGKRVSTIAIKRFDFVLSPDRERNTVFLARNSDETFRLSDDAQIEVVGRPFKDFGEPDRILEAVEGRDGRCWPIPEGDGPWVVYAKIDGIPRSRPVLVPRTLAGALPDDPLTLGLLERDPAKREAMLLAELRRAERGEAPETCVLNSAKD